MKRGMGMKEHEISDVFGRWNKGVLDSFLIEITTDILKYNDDDGVPLVTKIMDSAGQKVIQMMFCWRQGTGKWTASNALDLGQPVTLIGEAVFSRCLSSLRDERGRASKVIEGPKTEFRGDKKAFIDKLEQVFFSIRCWFRHYTRPNSSRTHKDLCSCAPPPTNMVGNLITLVSH